MNYNLKEKAVLAAIETPAIGQRDYFDRSISGLFVRAFSSGRRRWYLRYRCDGYTKTGAKRTHRMIGLSAASYTQAAAQAMEHLTAVNVEHRDPKGEKDAARSGGLSFKALADHYLKDRAAYKADRGDSDERKINNELVPAWGSRGELDYSR